MVSDGHFVHSPFSMLSVAAADIAKVAEWMAKILFEESNSLFLVFDLPTEDGHVLLLAKRCDIMNKDEMTHFVQFEYHTIGIVSIYRTAFDN